MRQLWLWPYETLDCFKRDDYLWQAHCDARWEYRDERGLA